MKNFESNEIREIFMKFFVGKDHMLIPGASIIPKSDPTLLFINSGMAPLKKYFLGTEVPPYPRLVNVQPCIRTNDIEDVGDRHHLTFFEMMGSWSIGDYYKEKAIELAYDLLVNHFGFPLEKLYATVYKGNPSLNIGPDDESVLFWQKVGLSEDHIVPLGEDNFWGPAGDSGPCGPCTEVFFDTGDEFGPQYTPGSYFDDANRYIEIWNAGVFMELNKDKAGNFKPLPVKSVDTGSGIERMYLALNKCESLYDVDTVLPVYELVKNILGLIYLSERDLRVVTDHLRTTTMILGEGVIPEKESRGYIARRLIRKSIAMALRADKAPFELTVVIDEIINLMKKWYPQLVRNRDLIYSLFQQEVKDFEPVIRSGIEIFNRKVSSLNKDEIPADFVFELVATHGVPFEIVLDLAHNNQLRIDEETYFKKYRKHQEISRRGLTNRILKNTPEEIDSSFNDELARFEITQFEGYKNLNSSSKIMGLIKAGKFVSEVNPGENCQIIFNKTPFYAESGGQVGDVGKGENKNTFVAISDVQKANGIYLHSAFVESGKANVGDFLMLEVDAVRRSKIAKNHSATHLLNSALRQILGSHVVQKGSLVNENKLRFDFLHNKALSHAELRDVEFLVNQWIWNNYQAKTVEMDYQDAIDAGAMALTSENYGSKVRVLNFGNVSVELCGGTHVKNSAEIGIFLIVQENSVAKGIRRIEAITGETAYKQVTKTEDLVKSLSLLTGTSSENLVEYIKKLTSKKKKDGMVGTVSVSVDDLIDKNSFTLDDGTKVMSGRLDHSLQTLEQVASEAIVDGKIDIVILVSCFEDTIRTLVQVNKKTQSKFPADRLINRWLLPWGGKGGGRPSLAKGGVKEKINLDGLLSSVETAFQ